MRRLGVASVPGGGSARSGTKLESNIYLCGFADGPTTFGSFGFFLSIFPLEQGKQQITPA